jgi:hypothetical protein
MTGREVRLLRALGEAETMVAVRTVTPNYALSCAATVHAVDEGSLAKLWLTKLICCSRARAVLLAFDQADEAEG